MMPIPPSYPGSNLPVRSPNSILKEPGANANSPAASNVAAPPPATGKSVQFHWTDDLPKTDDDVFFAPAAPLLPPQTASAEPDFASTLAAPDLSDPFQDLESLNENGMAEPGLPEPDANISVGDTAPQATAMAYPDCVPPGLWHVLSPLIERSPQLMQGLDLLRQLGWIFHCNQGQGTRCRSADKCIDLDVRRSQADLLRELAHEIPYALNEEPDPANFSSADEFVRAFVNIQAMGVVNNLQVRQELIEQGGPDIGIAGTMGHFYHQALAFFHLHRNPDKLVTDIGDMFAYERGSIDGMPYIQSLRNLYQQAKGLPPLPAMLPPQVDARRDYLFRKLQMEHLEAQSG